MLPCCEKLTKGSTCLRIFITFSSILSFVASAVAGVILVWAPEEPSLQIGGGEQYALVPGACLLGAAALTMLTACVGLLAVTKDSSCGLSIYGTLSVLIAVFTIACGATLFAFIYSAPVRDNLTSELVKEIHNNSSKSYRIQEQYMCCGASNYSDWIYNNSTSLPPSCCELTVGECSTNQTMTNDILPGCVDVLLSRLRWVVDASFGSAVVAGVLQLFTASLAWYGSWLIQKYHRYDIL